MDHLVYAQSDRANNNIIVISDVREVGLHPTLSDRFEKYANVLQIIADKILSSQNTVTPPPLL